MWQALPRAFPEGRNPRSPASSRESGGSRSSSESRRPAAPPAGWTAQRLIPRDPPPGRGARRSRPSGPATRSFWSLGPRGPGWRPRLRRRPRSSWPRCAGWDVRWTRKPRMAPPPTSPGWIWPVCGSWPHPPMRRRFEAGWCAEMRCEARIPSRLQMASVARELRFFAGCGPRPTGGSVSGGFVSVPCTISRTGGGNSSLE